MGSVQSWEKCNHCNTDGSLMSDFEYKVGNLYEFCEVCGYSHTKTFNVDTYEKVEKLCKDLEKEIGIPEFKKRVLDWVLQLCKSDAVEYRFFVISTLQRFGDTEELFEMYPLHIQEKLRKVGDNLFSSRINLSDEIALVASELETELLSDDYFELNLNVIQKMIFMGRDILNVDFRAPRPKEIHVCDVPVHYTYHGYGFGPHAMEYMYRLHSLSAFDDVVIADVDGVLCTHYTSGGGSMASYRKDAKCSLSEDNTLPEELRAVIVNSFTRTDYLTDYISALKTIREYIITHPKCHIPYCDSVEYTKLEPFLPNENPRWVRTTVYLDGRANEQLLCSELYVDEPQLIE